MEPTRGHVSVSCGKDERKEVSEEFLETKYEIAIIEFLFLGPRGLVETLRIRLRVSAENSMPKLSDKASLTIA